MTHRLESRIVRNIFIIIAVKILLVIGGKEKGKKFEMKLSKTSGPVKASDN